MRKEQIEKFVKNRLSLYYAYKVIKGFRNKEFKLDVIRMNECDLILNFKNYGPLHPDKNILYIYNDSDVRGFFSLFFLVLDGLALAERYHLEPVVRWGEHTLYAQANPINGSGNPFEYFFQQVSEVSADEVFRSSRVMLFADANRQSDYNQPYSVASQIAAKADQENQFILSNAHLYSKYIRFKPEVADYIYKQGQSVLKGKNVLGVHVRGTDFNKGYLNHAKAVSIDQYIEATKQALEEGQYDSIFLATDEEAALERFQREFGSRLTYYSDILRSRNGEALHFSENARENHKYLLGLEVLRDVMSLASCSGLIAGLSNVSLASRVIKTANDGGYAYCNIINNGFHVNGVRFRKSK